MTDQEGRPFYPGCLILRAIAQRDYCDGLTIVWRRYKVLDVTLSGEHHGVIVAGSLKVRDSHGDFVSTIPGDNCVIIGDEPLDFADRYEWMTGL